MDDLAACADLCESHGFAAPAAALRALAEGKAPFFLIWSRLDGDSADWYGFDLEDVGILDRKVFLDPATAERQARGLTTRLLRNLRYCSGAMLPFRLDEDDLAREVGAILGSAYSLPEDDERMFPPSVTDDQLERIGRLLTFYPFEVVEIGAGLIRPSAGGARPERIDPPPASLPPEERGIGRDAIRPSDIDPDDDWIPF